MSRSRVRRSGVLHPHQITRARVSAPEVMRDYEADLSIDGDSGRIVRFQAPNDKAARTVAGQYTKGEELVFEIRRLGGQRPITVFDLFVSSTW